MVPEDIIRLISDIVMGSDQVKEPATFNYNQINSSNLQLDCIQESIALTWAVYVLGRHPEAQKKIFEELNKVCGPGKKLDQRHLEDAEFLRSCVKEVLRLYPVPCFTTRFLQHDIIVGGYHVPAGVIYQDIYLIEVKVYLIIFNFRLWQL